MPETPGDHASQLTLHFEVRGYGVSLRADLRGPEDMLPAQVLLLLAEGLIRTSAGMMGQVVRQGDPGGCP